MVHEWVLDVLADLQSFADANDMNALAAHLEEAGLIAAAEIISHTQGVAQPGYGETANLGPHPSGLGCINRA